MHEEQLIQQIQLKKSLLCIGLDPDVDRFPELVKAKDEPVLYFNERIIAATHKYAVAYKLNLAFYESMGVKGWDVLAQTLKMIPKDILIIADAKRGDIGNTAKAYARSFFDHLEVDGITVSPYMGVDAVEPFLTYEGKWVFVLALTSNKGASDFQFYPENGEALYQRVLRKGIEWQQGKPSTLGFVVGATQESYFKSIRSIAPDAWLLVPGVGAQGGDLDQVCQYLVRPGGRVLVNSSRGILYASQGDDFEEAATKSAELLQKTMSKYVT